MKGWLAENFGIRRLFSTQETLGALDVGLLALLAALMVARAASLDSVPFLDFQDMGSYRQMAESPLSYFSGVPPHHAQRLLPSLIVWALHEITDLPIDTGFRLVSGLGFMLAHLLLFATLRLHGLTPTLAFPMTLLAAIAQWPVSYALRDVWQANDAWTYALSILMVLLTAKGRLAPLAVVAVLSVFVRQNVPILGVAALLHLALSQRSLKPLLAILFVVAAFGVNTILAGGGAAGVLSAHLVGNLVETQNLVDLIWQMNLPWLTLPFLPLYLCPAAWRAARRAWWILVFVLTTVGQALLVAQVGGIENTQRLIMPACWILVPIAGQVAKEFFDRPILQVLFAALPLSLPLSRLLFFQTEWQDLHDFRALPGALLVGLMTAAFLARRDRTERSVH